jgi:hypothetical protein
MLLRNTIHRTALFIGALLLATTSAFAIPSITVGESEVHTGGISPGGAAVVVSFGRGTSAGGGIAVRVFKQVLTDEDGDGAITVIPGYAIPTRSVWVVVDYQTGQYAISSPAGFTPKTGQVSATALKKDADGGIAFLDQNKARVALLLVRPEKGAWFHVGHLGGRSDANESSDRNKMTLSFQNGLSLFPGEQQKGPKHLRSGDVLIAIDPGHLEVSAMQVIQ